MFFVLFLNLQSDDDFCVCHTDIHVLTHKFPCIRALDFPVSVHSTLYGLKMAAVFLRRCDTMSGIVYIYIYIFLLVLNYQLI